MTTKRLTAQDLKTQLQRLPELIQSIQSIPDGSVDMGTLASTFGRRMESATLDTPRSRRSKAVSRFRKKNQEFFVEVTGRFF